MCCSPAAASPAQLLTPARCAVLCCFAVLCCCAGVAQFVRRAFEDSISGILNKRQVDVLHDIKRKRAKGGVGWGGDSHWGAGWGGLVGGGSW